MPDPHLDELWRAVLAAWDEDAAHQAFIERCRVTQQLGEAAARYRHEAREGGDEARVPGAKKRLEAVALLAVFELDLTRGSATPSRAAAVVSRVAALVLLAVIVIATTRFLLR